MNIKLKKLIPKYLTGGIPIFSPIEQKEFERNYKKMIESPSFYKLSKEDLTKLKQTWINESKKLGLGINETNKYISEKIKTYSLNSLLNNLSTSNLNNLSEKESNITETPVSQVYDNFNSEISLIPNLEELISNIKNRRGSVEQPVIKGEQKKNNPPVYDSKVIESYEKDPYNDLVLSEKAKESYENWLRSRHREPGKNNWESFKTRFSLFINNPELWGIGRLAVNLGYNDRIYNEYLKGLNPTLKQSYHTYRLIFGDEGTKLGYYRRAALLLTKAALPFTSNAETQLAAMFDAYNKGNQMRAEGDLADNKMIRETSELANQHLDANRLRDTEVANFNTAALNLTNALKHALLALKLSAEGSSIDNFLLGLEYRRAKDEALRKRLNYNIYALQALSEIENDPTLNDLKNKYEAASKLPINLKLEFGQTVINYDSPQMKSIKKQILQRMRELSIDLYRFMYDNGIASAKSGVKITKKIKDKDDLLYKSAKDVVEHFRKMIALGKRSNKSNNKIERLAPHPKGSTKKYLLGGVAPFLVYKPIALGGETTTSTSIDTSSTGKSSKSSSSGDDLDLMKELFKQLQVEGLPSDTNVIYSAMNDLMLKRELFGNKLGIDDLSSIFISLMNKINMIKYNKALFDKIAEIVHNKNADSEIAITPDGKVAVLDTDTMKIEYKKYSDVNPKKHVVLTNYLLLNMRALSPNMAFDSGMALMTAANATSMEEIAKFLKALLPAIESSESSILGYTKKDTADIKSGVRALLLDAPEGVYEFLMENKTNQGLIRKALEYLYRILPDNMRTLLDIKSGGQSGLLIATMLGAKEFTNTKTSVDAATGKASKNTNSSEEIKSNPIMLMILGQGGIPRTWEIVTKDSNIKMSVDGTYYSQIPKVTEDMSIDRMLSESGISGILDSKLGITFGDLNISSDLLKDIMYSNSGGMIVTLPCKIVNGHKEVNLGVKKSYEEAILEVESKGISKTSSEYNKALGDILKLKGLTSLLDSNGYPDKNKFSQFLVVEAYATSKIKQLDPSSQYLEKVKNPDELLELRLTRALSTDDKKSDYSLDIDYWFWGDDVYRGSVFIPLTNNINASINAWGDLIKIDESRELENKFLNFNKAFTAKSSNSSVL